MIEIPLTKSYVAIVDDEDSDLAAFSWQADVGRSGSVYARRGIGGSTKHPLLRMHRVVLERILEQPIPKGYMVDHIDGNGLNNSRSNLRLATRAQNTYNSKTRSTCGFKGVTRCWRKWKAQIRQGSELIYLGLYDTPEEAHEAYKAAATERYGEFVNFEVKKTE